MRLRAEGRVVRRGRLERQMAVGLARSFRRGSTVAEAALWKGLRGRRLGGLKFRRQHPVDGFIVDFYCAERRLIVEVDGSIHDRQWAADEERRAVLDAGGYRVVRLTNDTVLNAPVEALAAIRAAAAGPHPMTGQSRTTPGTIRAALARHPAPSPPCGEGE